MRILIWLTVVNAVIYGVVAFIGWDLTWWSDIASWLIVDRLFLVGIWAWTLVVAAIVTAAMKAINR